MKQVHRDTRRAKALAKRLGWVDQFNPPLSCAQREQIEVRMVGFYNPKSREVLSYNHVETVTKFRMSLVDAIPPAVRKLGHDTGFVLTKNHVPYSPKDAAKATKRRHEESKARERAELLRSLLGV